jgi:hypothetical protein
MTEPEEVRHWPVLAWIRLRLPEAPPPLQLTRGPPPPPLPPLDLMEPEPVATDPSVRLFSFSEPVGGGWLRLAWSASNPDLLNAEYREPEHRPRLPPGTVEQFWAAVKGRVAELGPLRIDGADPFPGGGARGRGPPASDNA